MPGYGGSGSATLLRENQQKFLFQSEPVPAGTASIAVQLERISRTSYPWGVSFQVYFTDVNGNPANPGAFELDIMDSDIDELSQYCMVSSLTTGLNATYSGRVELRDFYAKYVLAYVKTLTNSVYVTVLVTR
jgi:hypothetical protein